jgi:hypothetical protein
MQYSSHFMPPNFYQFRDFTHPLVYLIFILFQIVFIVIFNLYKNNT